MAKQLDWQATRARLERRRRAVIDEIRGYPAPITGCDAQFNHLTERRRLLNEALVALDAASREPGSTVEAFLEACSVIDEGALAAESDPD